VRFLLLLVASSVLKIEVRSSLKRCFIDLKLRVEAPGPCLPPLDGISSVARRMPQHMPCKNNTACTQLPVERRKKTCPPERHQNRVFCHKS
jgi:hypothetical protein